MYLDQVKTRLAELGTVAAEEMKSCSEEEIQALEARLGQRLPEAYKEFLRWMGHGGGRIMQGSDCFYQHLSYLRAGALRILRDDDFPQQLPDDAFVFCMHQGYQFSFMRLSEGEDPPIYYYLEDSGATSFEVVFPRFSELLMTAVNSAAKSKREN